MEFFVFEEKVGTRMKKNRWILLLFILGLSILVYPHVAQWVNQWFQQKLVEDFQNELHAGSEEEIQQLLANAQGCNEEIFHESKGFHDPFSEQEAKLQEFKKCIGLKQDEMFGAIEIPKLKLIIPIYLGADEKVLKKGIGQVEGSSIPIGGQSTHTVLAGHRGMGTKEMFRNIDKLIDGDLFYIHTFGETLTYRVYKQTIIYPNETDSLLIVEGKDLATLLTCHPYRHNYQRLLIHGERMYLKMSDSFKNVSLTFLEL